jgi:hypothetical protein
MRLSLVNLVKICAIFVFLYFVPHQPHCKILIGDLVKDDHPPPILYSYISNEL